MIIDIGKDWILDHLEVGPLMVNCYILAWKVTGEAIVIDPGDEAETIYERVKELGVKVTAIVNTHGHSDHITGNQEFAELSGAPILIGKKDAPMLTDPRKNLSVYIGATVTSPAADLELVEGDTVNVGGGELRVLEAPGHSDGSIVLAGDGFAFVGDVLFSGSVGRTDFPGGSWDVLSKSIHEKLIPLGDECMIFPGHGPMTTIGQEKRSNPFINMRNINDMF